jgi:hypothetical protein
MNYVTQKATITGKAYATVLQNVKENIKKADEKM